MINIVHGYKPNYNDEVYNIRCPDCDIVMEDNKERAKCTKCGIELRWIQ